MNSRKKKRARSFVQRSAQLETHRLRTKLKAAHKQRVAALQALDAATQRAALALEVRARRPDKVRPRRRSSKGREACAVILCSDWHVEETVDPATVNDLNAYDPREAERRAENLFHGAAWLTCMAARATTVRDAIVWLGGDLISGYIHEELAESNSLSPTEAILLVQRLVVAGLRSLLEQTQLEAIRVVCSYGNHGRTTPKRRVSTAAKNSFEWLAYHSIRAQLADEERITFSIADGAHSYAEVYGTTIRFHHGDDVRGGSSGLEAPTRRAVSAWDSTRKADLTVIGHYHQFRDYGRVIVNGSLIGWNAYAQSIRAQFEEPRQAWFLVDKARGKTLVSPLWVT